MSRIDGEQGIKTSSVHRKPYVRILVKTLLDNHSAVKSFSLKAYFLTKNCIYNFLERSIMEPAIGF